MPVNRPRRVRIIIIYIIVLHRAQNNLNSGLDGTVDETLCSKLARTWLMFEAETDTSVADSSALTAVVTAFNALADYVEQNEKAINVDTLEGLADNLGDALDGTWRSNQRVERAEMDIRDVKR